MNAPIKTPVDIAIAAINNAPRMPGGKRINWAADKSMMSKVAIALLSAPDINKATADITAATGVQSWTMRHFIRGNNASGGAEHEIREAIKKAGLEYVKVDGRKAQQVTTAPPKAIEPETATIDEHKRRATLAVTNKGEVTIAAPPTAATTPTAMIAAPGEFAVKTPATRTVLDTKTNDILVIHTTRIAFRSAEWCEKMVEINSKPKA